MKVILLLACWLISFLFAGIEAGLLALDPVRLRHRAKSGDRAAQRLQKMLENPAIKAAHDAQVEEFALLDELLKVRRRKGLTQAKVETPSRRVGRTE